jgi:hypothetical protein
MAATTFPIAATRAGQSAVVQESTARTYAAAMPAVLTENGSGSVVPPPSTAQVQAMVLA